MLVEIIVRKDDGTVVSQEIHDAVHPCEWKTLPDSPVVEGDWNFYGWTFQPRVKLASKAGGF